jgi:hypothetical protein
MKMALCIKKESLADELQAIENMALCTERKKEALQLSQEALYMNFPQR